MKCPLKFNSNTLDKEGRTITYKNLRGESIQYSCICEQDECAWWESRTAMCSVKVPAYLTAFNAERS